MTRTTAATVCPHVTAVILAGGQARRMAGADKALLALAGRPMLAHVIAALQPQVDSILISSNRPAAEYAAFELPVVPDLTPEQRGPLAGLISALENSRDELVLAVPCDTPCLPPDLVTRMCSALLAGEADVCTVRSAGQLHAAIMLVHRRVLPSLHRYLDDGGRKVQQWQQSMALTVVDFDDQPGAFSNINTPEELHNLERRLTDHGH